MDTVKAILFVLMINNYLILQLVDFIAGNYLNEESYTQLKL